MFFDFCYKSKPACIPEGRVWAFRLLSFIPTFLFLLISGCKGLKDNPKYKFSDGIYHTKIDGKSQSVFIENSEDSILIYSVAKGWKRLSVNSSSSPTPVNEKGAVKSIRTNKYWQNSFDIDLLTIPLKFRPGVGSFPKQFNTNLNGALYLGYRNDIYRLSYDKNPIGKLNQKITHYGISAGFMTGFGSTAMNPWVTNNQITIEYDGVVWSKGVAIVMGLDKFSFAIVGAVDHLLDGNKSVWLFQGKPYLGLGLGLNLN
jgi:hypothetical protein